MPERNDDSVASEVTSKSIVKSISYLEECVGILASGGGPMMGEGCIEQLSACLDSIVENTQGWKHPLRMHLSYTSHLMLSSVFLNLTQLLQYPWS